MGRNAVLRSAPPLLRLPRLGETNSQETAVEYSPVTPPCTLSRLELPLKRPGDYLLAEANISIPGRRLLGIYKGLPTATQGRGQDACVQPHPEKGTREKQFPDISVFPVLFCGSRDL